MDYRAVAINIVEKLDKMKSINVASEREYLNHLLINELEFPSERIKVKKMVENIRSTRIKTYAEYLKK